MVLGMFEGKTTFKYKEKNSFERRKAESTRARRMNENCVPVIVEKAHGDSLPDLPGYKFLVRSHLQLWEFQSLLRKKLKLSEEDALFLFVNTTLVCLSNTMQAIYDEHHEEDMFLYISYRKENTFGG